MSRMTAVFRLGSPCDLWTSSMSAVWDPARKADLRVSAHLGLRPTESKSALKENPQVIHTHSKV